MGAGVRRRGGPRPVRALRVVRGGAAGKAQGAGAGVSIVRALGGGARGARPIRCALLATFTACSDKRTFLSGDEDSMSLQALRVPTDKPAPESVCLDVWSTGQDWRAAASAGAMDDLVRAPSRCAVRASARA